MSRIPTASSRLPSRSAAAAAAAAPSARSSDSVGLSSTMAAPMSSTGLRRPSEQTARLLTSTHRRPAGSEVTSLRPLSSASSLSSSSGSARVSASLDSGLGMSRASANSSATTQRVQGISSSRPLITTNTLTGLAQTSRLASTRSAPTAQQMTTTSRPPLVASQLRSTHSSSSSSLSNLAATSRALATGGSVAQSSSRREPNPAVPETSREKISIMGGRSTRPTSAQSVPLDPPPVPPREDLRVPLQSLTEEELDRIDLPTYLAVKFPAASSQDIATGRQNSSKLNTDEQWKQWASQQLNEMLTADKLAQWDRLNSVEATAAVSDAYIANNGQSPFSVYRKEHCIDFLDDMAALHDWIYGEKLVLFEENPELTALLAT